MPSGDHLEARSCTPGVRVRLRVGPYFAGTVNTSPRAPNSARLPSGAISKFVTLRLTSTTTGRLPPKSSAIVTGTFSAFSDARSNR